MIIYRIEDSRGFGYKGDRDNTEDYGLCGLMQTCCVNWNYTTLMKDNCRPLPWKDNIPKCFLKRKGWIFGFVYEHDIMRYFSPYDLFIMSKFGGLVVKYEIDEKHVWRGYNQCVFFEEHSKIISKESTGDYTYVKEFGDWIDMEDFEEAYKEWRNDY